MAENMRYDIPKVSACFENKSENCQKYGNLYPWEAAQKVCPSGWHISTDKDWNILEEFLKDDSKYAPLSNDRVLLTQRTKGTWIAGNPTCERATFTYDNETIKVYTCDIYHEGIDWYGFGAIRSGIGKKSGNENKWVNDEIAYWTNVEIDSDAAVSRALSNESNYIQRNSNSSKESLFAVRCVQNGIPSPTSQQYNESASNYAESNAVIKKTIDTSSEDDF